MLQIDDAGSGSFVGGTCIGIYRPETNEYYFDIIPVEYYNKENFKKKIYLHKVVEIVSTAIDLFGVSSNETIEICRGYMFEKLKEWLTQNNFNYYCTHIDGIVQDVVEKSFERYTIALGIPENYIKYTKYPFHFHKLLRWVYADYENRIALCKIGWNSWQRIDGIKPKITEDIMKSNNIFCLKCGDHIAKGKEIKKLFFYSNKANYVYLHPECI